MKKGIEFADETWNPVWGCLNNCPYCFARPIAKRFASPVSLKEADYLGLNPFSDSGIDIYDDLRAFKPMLIQSQLEKKFKKNTTHVFVNSMSDIMYWNREWWQLVLEHVKKYPDKKFIFFTKFENVWNFDCYIESVSNAVLIKTINKMSDIVGASITKCQNKGICIEPMQEDLSSWVNGISSLFDWVIIGSETGNRKNKIEVKSQWLEPFYDLKIPVFMKESIRHLVPAEKFRQERI